MDPFRKKLLQLSRIKYEGGMESKYKSPKQIHTNGIHLKSNLIKLALYYQQLRIFRQFHFQTVKYYRD